MTSKHWSALLVMLTAVAAGSAFFALAAEPGSRPEERFEFSSYEQVQVLFEKLNYTHEAYAALRAKRAEMRSAGQRISGWELAETLDKYSERGAAYVESLHGIMRVNKLDPADDAFLGDGPTIFLVPVGEGAS